uniref:WD repeat-containing protein 75 isoform X2 n=1 Tax=Myxine glutinosa TaxID=7769 RepID=UPI00358EB187
MESIWCAHQAMLSKCLPRPRDNACMNSWDTKVYSSSLDGTIKVWDFMDGILIKTYLVHSPLQALFSCSSKENQLYVLCRNLMDQDEVTQYYNTSLNHLVSVQLPKSTREIVEVEQRDVILESVSNTEKTIAFSKHGDYIAAVMKLQLGVFDLKKKNWQWRHLKDISKKGRNNKFTCICCHPMDDCIATGHMDGKIRLWRNVQKKDYIVSMFHWHSDKVQDLAFSVGGQSLFTVGMEAVLVQWCYGSESERHFLPRLGAPIQHVVPSPCGSLLATSHTDNKIVLIHSCLDVAHIIQGLVHGGTSTGVLLDPRTRALVLNGKPGCLQFYCLHTDQLLYDLDVVQQEHIFPSNNSQIEVTKADFSCCGSWLATVEQRTCSHTLPELRLKFWSFQDKQQSFVLNTSILAPHEDDVLRLCFQPHTSGNFSNMLGTISKDGCFKIWIMSADAQDDGAASTWVCDFVGSYHNLPPLDCCFAEDGSLFAIAFGSIVTLWDPKNWEMRTSLCQPPGDVIHICFGRNGSSNYLLGGSSAGFLHVWNLLSCRLEWSVQLDVGVLVADPYSDVLAAFTSSASCPSGFVFRPSERKPLFVGTSVSSTAILSAVFVPRDKPLDVKTASERWLSASCLYFINFNQELLTLATESDVKETPTSKQLVLKENIPATPFSVLLGDHTRHHEARDESANPSLAPHLSGSLTIEQMLTTPAHILPPVTDFCGLFLSSLLPPSKCCRSEEEPVEVEEEDEEDYIESDSITNEETRSQTEPKVLTAVEDESCDSEVCLDQAQVEEIKHLESADYSWLNDVLL